MQVNWANFDEEGFKDGVTHPFMKYLSWMGALLHFYFGLLAYKYYNYTEDTEGKQDKSSKPIPSTVTVPTPSVPPPLPLSQLLSLPPDNPGSTRSGPLLTQKKVLRTKKM